MDVSLILRFFLTLVNTIMVGAGLYAVIYLVLERPSFENQALLALVSLVVGAILSQYGLSNGWWFSSSKGSSDKTELLREQHEHDQQHPPA